MVLFIVPEYSANVPSLPNYAEFALHPHSPRGNWVLEHSSLAPGRLRGGYGRPGLARSVHREPMVIRRRLLAIITAYMRRERSGWRRRRLFEQHVPSVGYGCLRYWVVGLIKGCRQCGWGPFSIFFSVWIRSDWNFDLWKICGWPLWNRVSNEISMFEILIHKNEAGDHYGPRYCSKY